MELNRTILTFFVIIATVCLQIGARSVEEEPSPRHLPHCRSRPGLCPYVRNSPFNMDGTGYHIHDEDSPPSLCGNLCVKDRECPGNKKCCAHHCGYACHDPVFLVD